MPETSYDTAYREAWAAAFQRHASAYPQVDGQVIRDFARQDLQPLEDATARRAWARTQSLGLGPTDFREEAERVFYLRLLYDHRALAASRCIGECVCGMCVEVRDA